MVGLNDRNNVHTVSAVLVVGYGHNIDYMNTIE